MIDLTQAVEIAARAQYEEQHGLVAHVYKDHVFETWDKLKPPLKDSYREQIHPAVTALHNAGLLKETNG